MRKILKLLTFILAAIGVCTAALVCFILIYPVFYGDFSSKEARVPKALSDTQEENPRRDDAFSLCGFPCGFPCKRFHCRSLKPFCYPGRGK